MNGEYFVVMNLEEFSFRMFEKAVDHEDFEILGKKDNVLLLHKVGNRSVLTNQQIQTILSFYSRYSYRLVFDISKEVSFLAQKSSDEKQHMRMFFWMLRQSVARALLEKDDNID